MSVFKFNPNPNWTLYLEARCAENLEEDTAAEKGLFNQVRFSVYIGWEAAGAREKTEREIGFFCFSPMPGCCGVVVSTGSWLEVKERGSNIGEHFHQLKAFVAKQLGYSRMLATTQTKNFPELIGAAKHGWKLHEAFINTRTGEQLTVMEKAI